MDNILCLPNLLLMFQKGSVLKWLMMSFVFLFRQRLELMREMCQNEGDVADGPVSPLHNKSGASSQLTPNAQDSNSSFSYAGGDPFYDRFPW